MKTSLYKVLGFFGVVAAFLLAIWCFEYLTGKPNKNLAHKELVNITETSLPIPVQHEERYESGSLQSIGKMQNDQKFGEWIYYHPNGEFLSKGWMENDYKQGEWIFYHKNGAKKCQGNYTDNERDGFWEFWNENGDMTWGGSYRNSLHHGIWYKYNKGVKQDAMEYEHGTKKKWWKLHREYQ